jgi:hypothetical protein
MQLALRLKPDRAVLKTEWHPTHAMLQGPGRHQGVEIGRLRPTPATGHPLPAAIQHGDEWMDDSTMRLQKNETGTSVPVAY